MASNTSISWCHDTFNMWWGCWKISPGCQNCYAAAFDHRVSGKDGGHWGRTGSRKFQSDEYWAEPLKWNARARREGKRRRVFCGSMCDWAEIHPDPKMNAKLDAARARLWALIAQTEWLDWLLLTKRPENVAGHLPKRAYNRPDYPHRDLSDTSQHRAEWAVAPWPNVWLGTTVENSDYAWRIDTLREIPATIHFLSCEPLLGLIEPIDLRGIEWLIAGAESGHHARECEADWLRALRDQCNEQGVAFFLKQAVWSQPITIGLGSKTKGKGYNRGDILELPYLDNVQHKEVPRYGAET